jgi:hypothetical protein
VTRGALTVRALAGAVVGFAGSLAARSLLGHDAPFEPLIAIALGAAFTGIFGEWVTSVGGGLLWGVALALFAWLLLPSTREAPQVAFAGLVACVTCFGVPLGIATGLLKLRDAPPISIPRGLTSGALAGLLGGWAFSKWMEQVNFFPLIAGIVNSHSSMVGIALHYAIAVTIGVSFGLLFQREIRGLGSSLGWGAAYGTLWWFIGPLTLLPLLTHAPLDWSYDKGASIFGSLVGHIIYGLILGTFYAAIDRFWVRVFYESDPINREPEGPGLQTIHALQWGFAGGAAGALGAELVRATSAMMVLHEHPLVSAGGWLAGIFAGAAVGAAYGFLFAYEAPNVPASLAWGLVFGTVCWFAGPLTVVPIAHGLPFRWTTQASAAALPDLVGDLLYGLITAVVYLAFERRHYRRLAIDRRYAARLARRRRPAGTSAPAVWFFFVGCAVTLPLLFG